MHGYLNEFPWCTDKSKLSTYFWVVPRNCPNKLPWQTPITPTTITTQHKMPLISLIITFKLLHTFPIKSTDRNHNSLYSSRIYSKFHFYNVLFSRNKINSIWCMIYEIKYKISQYNKLKITFHPARLAIEWPLEIKQLVNKSGGDKLVIIIFNR